MECWHMSGAGNDFMVIDARGLTLDFEDLAKRLCALSGADGFMAVDHSREQDFKLHFYNSDGTRGEMCGNGARCICRFAYDHGIAGEHMVVETDAGPVPGTRLDRDNYRVQLNRPTTVDLDRTPEAAYVELGCPGLPHAVAEYPELTWSHKEQLRPLARQLRFHSAFPKGANVNFYRWLGPDTVRILTYERGVEDYTLACGTGCGSTATVLWSKGLLPEGKLTLENNGGTLHVTVTGENGSVDKLILEGPTQILQVYEI